MSFIFCPSSFTMFRYSFDNSDFEAKKTTKLGQICEDWMARMSIQLVFKGRIHRFLKEKLARRSWAIDAIVGAICRGRGSDSLGRLRGFNSAMNQP